MNEKLNPLFSPFTSFYPLKVNVPPHLTTSTTTTTTTTTTNDALEGQPHQEFNDPIYLVWRQSMMKYLHTLPNASKAPPELKNLLAQLAASLLEAQTSKNST
ncbi:hypothetical protein HMI55_002551 [Coelomomyces lativittatus]|nr:hypothetical protein HMI55_002551 [Coelomomyces lativittatus]